MHSSEGATALPEDARILLRRARSGSGTLLVLTGADRWGREAALENLAQEAERRGWSVLKARGSPAQREVPFGALQELLERLRPTLPPSRVPAPLASLFSLGPDGTPSRKRRGDRGPTEGAPGAEDVTPEPEPTWGAVPRDEGFRAEEVRAELTSLLLPASSGPPRLLAVSDAEYLDEASRGFFTSLGEGLERVPLGVALSLVDSGRPREEWQRSLVHTAAVWTRVGVSAPAARRATDEVVRKVKGLDAAALRAAAAAVLAGPDARLPFLSVALGTSSAELEEALTRAAAAGALWREGPRFHPTEPAVSEALLTQVGAAEVRRLHAQIARGIRKLTPVPHGNVLFRLSTHWTRAGNAPEALPALLAAAAEARRRGAASSAEEELRRAVLLAQREPSPELRLWEERAHSALGALLSSSGQVAPAIEEHGRALRLARARSPSVAVWGPHEARILTLLESSGAADGVEARLRALAAEAQKGKVAAVEAEALSTLVHLCARRAQGEEALALATRAVARAEASGDVGLLARALRMVSLAQLEREDLEALPARSPLERALSLAREARDVPSQALVADALGRVGDALGESDEALLQGEEARRLARRSGSRLVLLEVLVRLAGSALDAGKLDRAEEVLREVQPELDPLQLGAGHPLTQATLLARARLRLSRGEVPTARLHLLELVASLERSEDLATLARALQALATAHLRSGDRADARRTVHRLEHEGLARRLNPSARRELDEVLRELGPG